jgi:hypothetical protein
MKEDEIGRAYNMRRAMRNILDRKPEGNKPNVGVLSVDRRLTFNCILKKWGVVVQTGLNWLK